MNETIIYSGAIILFAFQWAMIYCILEKAYDIANIMAVIMVIGLALVIGGVIL